MEGKGKMGRENREIAIKGMRGWEKKGERERNGDKRDEKMEGRRGIRRKTQEMVIKVMRIWKKSGE